jgi:uroporphyrinogen-III synthase
MHQRNKPVRVIVTRPQPQAHKWLQAFTQAGHDAVGLALIDVAPAPDTQKVLDAWDRLATWDAVMFVSANAVIQFFTPKTAAAPVFNAWAAIKLRAFVTGPGSLAALLQTGIERHHIDAPDTQAGQFDSEALWDLVSSRVVPGYRVLIVRGIDAGASGEDSSDGIGRNWFANQVLAHGGTVDFVVSYQRMPPQWSPEQYALAREAAQDGSIWLFTSSQAIANLLQTCPDQRWNQARAVVSHPRIAHVATRAGFSVVCESRPALADLIASIESLA